MAEYKVGQVWRYQTRAGEGSSLLYIAKIDELPKSKIYHVFVDGLAIRNPLMIGGIQSCLPYAPISQEALDQSVQELVGATPDLPDISRQYNDWKQGFDSGQSGVFTIPVSKIIQYLEDFITKQLPRAEEHPVANGEVWWAPSRPRG